MKVRFRYLAAGMALCLLGSACSPSGKRQPSVKADDERKQAPDFALKDVNGATVRLADYRGRVVLLNFWATWCAPCAIEIPWFVEFEQKYKDRGFSVIGIAMDEEGWEVVRPFLRDMEVNYRTLMGNDMIAQQYGGVESLPTTFLIDRQGMIASVHLGLVSKSSYHNEIQQLLSAPPAKAGSSATGSGVPSRPAGSN